MELNQAVLGEVLAWGQALPGFKPSHAKNALTIVQGYVDGVVDEQGRRVEGVGDRSHDKLCLFARDVTWIFWLDMVFDAPRGPDEGPVDVESILLGIEGQPSTPEASGFSLVRSSFSSLEPSGDYRLWLDTASRTVRAWRLEGELSSGAVDLSYAEYLDNGVHSSAVPHMMTTASILYGLGLSSRLHEEAIRRTVRHLSISSRLHNDLASVEKERREGTMANAVLLLGRKLPAEQARDLVIDDLRGYERMLDKDIAALGHADPIARLATVMPEAHRLLHDDPRGDYRAAPPG